MSTKLLPYVNSKTVSSIPDIQILEASSAYYEYSNLPNILLPGYDIKNWFDNHSQGDSIILIDAGNYNYIDAYKDNTNQMHINIHYNNVLIGSFFQNVGEYPWIYLGVGVDDANQLGYAVVLYRQGDDSNTKLRAYGICQSTSAQGNLYSLLRGAVPIPSNLSGGAGSGYIGNSLLSNKKMVGYNVPTSSAESTKTESVNEASETPVSGKPKIGNGFARIKFLRNWIPPEPPNGFKIYNLDDEIGVKRDWNSMKVTTVRDVVEIVENAGRGNIVSLLDMGWTWTGLNIEPKNWSGNDIYLYDKNYDQDYGNAVFYIGILNYGTSNDMYMLNSDGTSLAEQRSHNWSSKQTPQGYCYASYGSESITCNYEGGIYIPSSINVYLNDQLYRPASV